MAMPPTADHREQARLCQLREMGAGGLRPDLRRKGQLARGQGPAIEKRRHHRGSRRVSDQRRDLGDDRACNHFRYVTPESVDAHFDGDRSGLPGSTAPSPACGRGATPKSRSNSGPAASKCSGDREEASGRRAGRCNKFVMRHPESPVKRRRPKDRTQERGSVTWPTLGGSRE